MKDQPLVENIKIRYYDSNKPKSKWPGRIINISVAAAFIVMIIFLIYFANSK